MVFVVLAALGYIGYEEREPVLALLSSKHSTPAPASSGDAPTEMPGSAPDGAGRSTAGPRVVHEHAPPGIFYMIDRAKVTSSTGIKAVSPGEEVKLLERLPGGKMRVTVDHADFTVYNWQVTDDLDIARDAERRFLETQGGLQ